MNSCLGLMDGLIVGGYCIGFLNVCGFMGIREEPGYIGRCRLKCEKRVE